MHRRSFLATVGLGAAGLAGCLTTPSGDDGGRRIAPAGQDDIAEEHDVTIDVEVLEAAYTDAHPARIRITTTNTGPTRALSVGAEGCALFNRAEGGSDAPPGLWLYRPEKTEYLERDAGQWVPDRPADQPRGYPGYGCGPVVYASGEGVSTTYEVWDDYRVEGYLVPGTYRWATEVSVWDGPEADGEPITLPWGFSIAVETRS